MNLTAVNIADPSETEKRSSVVFAVVLNWNGAEDTIKCIDSLLEAKDPFLEVVIVDNASTDGSVQRLTEAFPAIPLIRRPSNGGYAAGNNAGIRYAIDHGADYVLLVNNDTIVEHGFLRPMIAAAAGDESIGVVTCKAFFQSNRNKIYCTGGSFSWLRCSGAPMRSDRVDTPDGVSYVSGCILLVKRNVFETLGLLDERYFMYFEDLEFSRRVAKRFKLYYTPKGIVYHKSGGGDSWKNYSELYLYYNTRNRFWAFRDENGLYRSYVVFFSLSLAVVKSIAIMAYGLRERDDSGPFIRVRAIWRGVKDGLLHNK